MGLGELVLACDQPARHNSWCTQDSSTQVIVCQQHCFTWKRDRRRQAEIFLTFEGPEGPAARATISASDFHPVAVTGAAGCPNTRAHRSRSNADTSMRRVYTSKDIRLAASRTASGVSAPAKGPRRNKK